MNIYFAPLEGITGYIFRNAFNDIISSDTLCSSIKIDKYFSPFIAPGINQPLSKKELRDILPENNRGIRLIPQLLGSRADDILLGIQAITKLGYSEININLGCPSGTVVAKKKGSGLLAYTDELDEFLYKIYDKTSSSDIKISVKTRIGKENRDEFFKILDIYNKYQMEELIIHPRIQKDFYKNKPDTEMFDYAVKHSKNILCYNGDITNTEQYENIKKKYQNSEECRQKVKSIMIGRGFLKNPLFIYEIAEAEKCIPEINTKTAAIEKREKYREKIKQFHDRLLDDYKEEMSGERPVLFKMKELWSYMGENCKDSEKLLKKIRKAESIEKYLQAANELLIL